MVTLLNLSPKKQTSSKFYIYQEFFILSIFSDYFLGQISFKNFNELWIRNNDKQDDSTTVDDEQNTRRIYYIWILFIAILLFIFVIHKITQYVLLRVMIKTPKVTYDQVPSSLPNYI